jgi:hypothetical protein
MSGISSSHQTSASDEEEVKQIDESNDKVYNLS